ncbi:hypothetical protein [Alkalilimnicola sp. S0819]|uniref:hypothetical protein n=1 Tax=Alkalilimnicola sp. S0819 TaxID=2613922 RepID=UPI0012616ED5|nr:hypothetical protein [Alkalilimnicola sp. S0819]KAB7624323.1 hypothetical protein F3N43_05815 [Alkalilimnicola sp. S0819]MPQ16148.1 hypothetical protein [Alkalilimnicola sp. S0819]
MRLLSFRDAVVAGISQALTELKSCEAHGGRFDEKELRRYALRAPAVLVAVRRIPALAAENEITPTLTCAAFVVTRDARGRPRDAAGLALVEALLQVVANNTWGLDWAHRPQRLEADNLYSAALDKQGVALWGVAWQQAVDLAPEVDSATLADFITHHQDYDLAPADGTADASDTITLAQE